MRNFSQFLIIGCLLALPAAAQRGGGMRGGGSHGGGGSHAGGSFSGRSFGGSGFRGRSGGFGGSYRGYGGYGRGFYGGFRGYGSHHGYYGHNRFNFGFGFAPYAYWPYYGWDYPYYGYSSYYGYPNGASYGASYGYQDPYYDYGYNYSSPPAVVYQSDPAPPVRADEPQERVRPEVREYSQAAPSQSHEKQIYLIAFRNQENIHAAEAYWVTGAILHYVTLQHEQKQAPLDSVDRAFSYKLNRERRVDFRLPDSN
jgi:hypothetical protein